MPTAESINLPQTGKVEFFKPDALPSRRQPTDFDLAYKWLRGSVPIVRNEKYLALMREYPCVVCGAPADGGVHHVLSGFHGIKSTDYATIPLCMRHHQQTENDPAFMRECLKYLIKQYIVLLTDIYEKSAE